MKITEDLRSFISPMLESNSILDGKKSSTQKTDLYDLDLNITKSAQSFEPMKITDTQTSPPTDCYQCNQSRGSGCMNCF